MAKGNEFFYKEEDLAPMCRVKGVLGWLEEENPKES
jgi:hypothetical protein